MTGCQFEKQPFTNTLWGQPVPHPPCRPLLYSMEQMQTAPLFSTTKNREDVKKIVIVHYVRNILVFCHLNDVAQFCVYFSRKKKKTKLKKENNLVLKH